MAIISKITPAIKKFSGKPLAIASKMIGAAACASIVYDSHINAKERAHVTNEIESGDRYYNQYKQYMTCDKESQTICDLKETWYDMQKDFPFYSFISKTKGYVGGFAKTLVKNLPYIGLSALALSKFKIPSKVAGVALGLAGIKTILFDVMGFGSKKEDRI